MVILTACLPVKVWFSLMWLQFSDHSVNEEMEFVNASVQLLLIAVRGRGSSGLDAAHISRSKRLVFGSQISSSTLSLASILGMSEPNQEPTRGSPIPARLFMSPPGEDGEPSLA